MARTYRHLGLSAEQIALVKKNTRLFRFRGASIDELLEKLGTMLTQAPADLVIVNPLSAYAEEGLLNQKANREALYGKVDPFLTKHKIGIVFVHHTPKFRDRDKEKSHYESLYASYGDSTLANWPRGTLSIEPTKIGTIFKLRAGKRHRRIGWDSDHLYLKWSEPAARTMHWDFLSPAELTAVGARDEKGYGDFLALIPWSWETPLPRDQLNDMTRGAGITREQCRDWLQRGFRKEDIWKVKMPSSNGTKPFMGYAQTEPPEERKWGK